MEPIICPETHCTSLIKKFLINEHNIIISAEQTVFTKRNSFSLRNLVVKCTGLSGLGLVAACLLDAHPSTQGSH